MLITKLEKIDKKRTKVYIDYEYAFLLYPSDIRKYKIEEEQEITVEIYEEILEDTIYRRAKQKALAILKFMDRSESELVAKLKMAHYTEEIVNRTIEYVRSYHYIDDERYATNYIVSRKDTKSRKQIQMELLHKGISKEVIENIFPKNPDNDKEALKKAIRKKTDDIENLSMEQKQKLFTSLYRKGFSYEDIARFLTD